MCSQLPFDFSIQRCFTHSDKMIISIEMVYLTIYYLQSTVDQNQERYCILKTGSEIMSAEKKSHSKPDNLIINSTTGMNGKFKNRVLIAHIGPKTITFHNISFSAKGVLLKLFFSTTYFINFFSDYSFFYFS